jgi:hypothetical protein
MQDAVNLKFNGSLVWATLRDPLALEHGGVESLSFNAREFARLGSCRRILIDCRKLDLNRAQIAPDWQQTLLRQFGLPQEARAALVFDRCGVAEVERLRAAVTHGPTIAVFTNLRAAGRWLRAVDAQPLAHRRKALPLGVIKELLHQFVLARRDADRTQLAVDLGALYRFLLDQAEHMGIDPQLAIELYRSNAAQRRPKLVHSREVRKGQPGGIKHA